MSIQCVRCSQDSVNVLTDHATVSYRGNVLSYDMIYSLCSYCGDEFISADQIKQNDQALRNAKRESDGIFSPSEIRETRDFLGLSQELAAKMFGGGRNAFSKYERGEVVLSQSMDTLLKLCKKHKNLVSEIAEMRAITEYSEAADNSKLLIIRDVHRMADIKVRKQSEINDVKYNIPKSTLTLVPRTTYQRAS